MVLRYDTYASWHKFCTKLVFFFLVLVLSHRIEHLFKGTLTRDFRPLVFFIKQLPLGPWDTGWSLFQYVLVFAEKIDFVIADFCRSGVNDSAVTCTAESLTPLWQNRRLQRRFSETCMTCTGESLTPLCKYDTALWLGWSRKWIFLLTRKSTFFRKYFYLRVITHKYS
jgi:hypothetical protein